MSKSRSGFTIVEMLVTVLVLGILAAIALPRYTGTRDKAKLAAVKSDVRNVRLAEEAYFSDNGTYATLPELQSSGFFKLSSNNTLFIKARGSDYLIRVTDPTIDAPIKMCTIQVGAGIAANIEGVISCS